MGIHEANSQLVIDADHGPKDYFKDLIRYRELFYFFAWRDILVRYKQAFFGASWAVFRPLLNMAIFALIFGRIANLPSDNVSYGLFVLAALLPWQLFAGATIDTCNGLVNNAPLVSKIYFPRIIIPSSQIVVNLLDFSIVASLLLLWVILCVGFGWPLLILPCWAILTSVLCLGTGFWLAALTVKFRDFRILVPFFVQFMMFVSPVGYGTFVVPEKWQWLYSLNPLVGIIDGFRWSFFGQAHSYFGYSIISSIFISTTILISGFFYFRKMERTIADKI